jgi:hypothetical protein
MSNVPASTYVNPAFATPPPVDPNAFVQAMSFMATPAGAQSMVAFASHMAGVEGPPPGQLPQAQQVQPSPRYPSTQQSGQKRKRDDRKSSEHTQSQSQSQRKPQSSSKPPRAKAAVPPPVPTFGFTMPIPSPASALKPNQSRDNRKGKVRLGLTAQEAAPEESSEEEAIDEEAALGAKLKGGGYAFEHEGEHISLQTTGDIAEWIKDRRRNFPTYQKALEKAQAAATKRKNELEFVRKLKGKPPQKEEDQPAREVAPTNFQRTKRGEKKQEELAALRKKLHESMMKKKGRPTAIDLGLGYVSATESDGEESSVLSDSSVLSSSEESSDESSDEAEDSDAPPEPTSSKIAPPPINVPPPTKIERKPDKEKMCKSWKQYGKCSFGQNCRYKHPEKEEKRTGLYEKLVEQELVKTDQLTLDAIKYLGQNGFLG